MKKLWITMLLIILLTLGITFGISILNSKPNNEEIAVQKENELKIEEVSETVTDECVEEYEQLEKKEVEANSDEEKISPNCKLTLKQYYTKCKHTINKYLDIPENLVNKTKEDLEKEYPNWTVEKYSSTNIIIYKEFDGNCGEHYILKNDGGKIVVYLKDEDGKEKVYEKTEISVEYLPETDKIEIEKGIKVFGKENLNETLENYE